MARDGSTLVAFAEYVVRDWRSACITQPIHDCNLSGVWMQRKNLQEEKGRAVPIWEECYPTLAAAKMERAAAMPDRAAPSINPCHS
jgi:hypothetical protein